MRRHRPMQAALALAGALSVAGGSSDVDPKVFDTSGLDDEPPTGCFFYGFRFYPTMANISQPIRPILSPLQCQKACKETEGCATFNYVKESTSCFLGTGEHSGVEWDSSSVAGPVVCEKVPSACTASLPAQFPGNTPEETLQISSTGLVPPKLQCWPRNRENQLESCAAEPIRVLEDVHKGWTAQCDGLVKVTLTNGETCEENCRKSATCPSYQVLNTTWAGLECWQGLGHNCWENKQGLHPIAAQRFLRGSVRVLKDLTGIQVMGLVLSFGLEDTPVSDEIVSRCRNVCYSSITCSVWILSSKWGCYVEDTLRATISWPPTTSTFNAGTELARTVVAGEYIQHQCGNFEVDVTTKTARSCAAYPKCAGLSGDCCPTPTSIMLGCCGQGGHPVSNLQPTSAAPAAPAAQATTPIPEESLKKRISFKIQHLDYSKLSPSEESELSDALGELIAKATDEAHKEIESARGTVGRVSLRPEKTGEQDEGVALFAELDAGSMDTTGIEDVLKSLDFRRSVVEVTRSVVSKEAVAGPLAVSDSSARSVLPGESPFTAAERERPIFLSPSPTPAPQPPAPTPTPVPALRAAAPMAPAAPAVIEPTQPPQPHQPPQFTAGAVPPEQPITDGTAGNVADKALNELSDGNWWQQHGKDVTIFTAASVFAALLLGGVVVFCCFSGNSKKRGAKRSTRNMKMAREDSEEPLRGQHDGESNADDGDFDSSVPLFGVPNLHVPALTTSVDNGMHYAGSPTPTYFQAGAMYA
eukprot:TRINITY_DN12476_c0_g3_i1.p1 TRINITY_DN12476_c0_g3~~TRINITY_DN12476_c0_g3_i1.p1  ORF type:complete len:787 (+),score=136.53 TRINITY_DN12476_c0_g3_i1:93-2363(+)